MDIMAYNGSQVNIAGIGRNWQPWVSARFLLWVTRWAGRKWQEMAGNGFSRISRHGNRGGQVGNGRKKVHRGYLVGNGFSRSTRHSPTTLYLCFCLCSYHSLIFIIHSPPDELDCVFSYRFIFHKEINEIRMISSFFVWLPLYFIITLIIVSISVSTQRKSIINHQYETTVRISEIYV